MLYPKEYLSDATQISVEMIEKNNIKGIILDVDNTLIDFDRKLLDGVEDWVEKLKKHGIKFCILSNSNNITKVSFVAEKLQIPYISFARKPLKIGFKKAKEILELKEQNIAVVGDQIMTDVLGANRCKMFSILVKPIKEKDYVITKIKRPIERLIINRYLKKQMRERGFVNVYK